MATISLIGPGAIGCTLLGSLSRNRQHTLAAVARTPFDRLVVETDQTALEAEVKVITQAEQIAGPSEWILVCVKTYDFSSAIPWIDRLSGPESKVAIIQNGIEHMDRVPGNATWSGVVPVIIDCPVERIGPGHVRQRGPVRMTVPDNAAGREFRQLCDGTGMTVKTTDDWTTVAWRKLCLNAIGAINAVVDLPVGIIHLPEIENLARAVAEEVVAVGRACGARIDSSLAEEVVNKSLHAPRNAVNSIHADRAAGRPMEIDARNGVIVRLGKKHGIPTPRNETLVALLEALANQ